ncbi:MAG: DUF302 domain-containing protein [Acidiferrobacterales bacterium]
MQRLFLAVLLTLFSFSASAASKGVITMRSANDVKTTVKLFKKALRAKKMTIFKVIDHAKGAKGVGLRLRPTTVVIFGNPKVGTKFMQCSQAAAIDFPMKMLIREDSRGRVWISYNDPNYLARRHGVRGCSKVRKKMAGAQKIFARAAVKKAPPKKGFKDYNPFKKKDK